MIQDTNDASGTSLITMHEFDDVRSLSEEILLAVEELDARDHRDHGPLYSYLDPDALDALFVADDGEPRVEAKLSFEYDDLRVDVDTTGNLLVVQVS